MRRLERLLFLFLVLVLGSGVASAQSEKPRLQLCGAQGCVAVTSLDAFLLVTKALEFPATRPAPVGNYFLLRLKTSSESKSVFYVPTKSGAFFEAPTPAPTWHFVPRQEARPLFSLASQVSAFERPRISGVVIGGKAVRKPAPYADIFSGATQASATVRSSGFTILIKSNAPNPWFGPEHKIVFFPGKGLISVDGVTLRPSVKFAALLQKDLRRRAGGGQDRSGLWLAIGILLGVSVFLIGAERERRRQTGLVQGGLPPVGEPAGWPLVRIGTVAVGFLIGVGAIAGGVFWFEGAWSWVGVVGGGALMLGAAVVWIGLGRTALWIGVLSGAAFLIELIHQVSRHA
jgi:hypothetical protein